MKKGIFAALILLASLLLTSCSLAQTNSSSLNDYLIANSIRLARIMGDFAKSDAFINYFHSGFPDAAELARPLGSERHDYPDTVIIIKVSDNAINSAMRQTGGEFYLPDEARQILLDRLFLSVPSQIHAQQGIDAIVAQSMLSLSFAFASHPYFAERTYVILIYQNAAAITAFTQANEGIISAFAMPLFLDEDMAQAIARRRATEHIAESLALFGISNIEEVMEGIEIEYIALSNN